MPDVNLELDIRAPVEDVWQAVVDVEQYPESMESVRSIQIEHAEGGTYRRSAWSVILQGSVLKWVEEERIDRPGLTIAFEQLSGDMAELEGAWRLERTGPGSTRVRLDVSFEIGIPLLADMLNPVAQRSLRENCTDMLRGIEREALVT